MLESLRKFGLEYCDFPTMVNHLALFLRTLILNIDRTYTEPISLIHYITAILTGGCYFYVYVCSMVWFVFVKCRETNDVVAASVVFSLFACSFPGVGKFAYTRIHKTSIMNSLEEFLACDRSIEPGNRFSSNLLKALRIVKRRAMALWLVLIFNGIFFIAIAVVRPGKHFPEDFIVVYGLEPMYETPNYEIAFTVICGGVYFAINGEINITGLHIVLAGYIEAQILALSEELNNLWEDAISSQVSEDEMDKKKVNEYVHGKLRDIVQKHQAIISLSDNLDKSIRGAMTIEFACASSGLIAELLGGLENTYIQLPYTVLEVAMDCFIGQRLIDASLVLKNAVYSCKWENFNNADQKTVYLMLMNSQKTLQLTVGGITVLSYVCLMSVLKSIYSAYTALHSRM